MSKDKKVVSDLKKIIKIQEKIIKKQQVNNTLDLSQVSPGVYIVKVKTAHNKSYSRKIMIYE